ncbi:MAG: triosephosphate isomerase [Pirellulaceae bacterium]|nr:MAG: triosephosphate isomerase [Pirellulaceae bacterium]
MRRRFLAGNWKMHLTKNEALRLVDALAGPVAERPDVDVAVCPPFVYLDAVARRLEGRPLAVGAQNVSDKPEGAFTGEVSAGMLADIGCRYVIVGHSERRQFFGEDDAWVLRKAQAALAAGLTPIICLGETLAQRQAGETAQVIRRQFNGSVAELPADQAAQIVIAYEPVWAIGTGVVATAEQAEEVHADLRNLLAERYNPEVAQTVRILYGGSVKPDNAESLLTQPNVDGALVGGASLQATSFLGILAAVPKH